MTFVLSAVLIHLAVASVWRRSHQNIFISRQIGHCLMANLVVVVDRPKVAFVIVTVIAVVEDFLHCEA